MPVGRAKGHRRIGRFEPYFEVAESFLGPLWAARVVSGPGAGLVGLVREVAAPAEVAGRLLEAATRAMSLRHGEILQPLEVGRIDTGGVFVVTDYLEGETLRSLQGLSSVRRKPIEIGVALRIATDLLHALVALHGQGSGLYGGICPDSIYVDTSGRTSLLDIGVGALAASVEAFGGQSERIAYLAPEQVDRYESGIADARTDVFAMGILLWEMLSNRRLFIGSDRAVAQKVLAGKIPPLDQVKRRGDFELSRAIVGLVARALERDPAARFQTIAEMLEALEATGSEPAPAEEVAALVTAVGESSIERRVDAMRDVTEKPTTERLSRVLVAAGETAAPARALPIPGPAAPSHGGVVATPQGSSKGRPPMPIGRPAAAAARPPGRPVLPAVPARAPAASAGRAAAAARPRFQTMLGMAPAPTAAGPRPQPVPPPPPAAVVPETSPSPAPVSRAEVSSEPSDGSDDFPDSAIEPVGTIPFEPRPAAGPPLAPVPPPVQDALDAGARWPVPSPEPRPAAASPVSEEPEPAAVEFATAPSDPPLPRPPALPDTTVSVSASRAPGAQPRSAIPTPVSVSAPRGASMPPAALFASKVPPPLIHDPRAKRRAETRERSGGTNGILLGVLGAVVVVVAGVALGLYVVQTQEASFDRTAAPPGAVGGAPAVPAAPVDTPEPAPAPAATPDPASAEGAGAAPASGAAEPAAAEPAAGGAAAEPTPAASVPPPTEAAPVPPTPPPPATPYRPAAPVRRPPKKKFVPDDI
jgi:eukaryotic-like serine/threonine-protein kinase